MYKNTYLGASMSEVGIGSGIDTGIDTGMLRGILSGLTQSCKMHILHFYFVGQILVVWKLLIHLAWAWPL